MKLFSLIGVCGAYKMSQTNAKQIKLLVEFMEKNPALAKNSLESSVNGRKKKSEAWSKLSTVLNSNGPPERNVSGWQKVWRDYKYNAKRKLRSNLNSQRQTGGGSCELTYISPLEEAAITAAGLEAEVSGLRSVRTFGAPSCNSNKSIEDILNEWESEDLSTGSGVERNNSRNKNSENAQITEESEQISGNKENESNNITPNITNKEIEFNNITPCKKCEQIALIKEELKEKKDFHSELLKLIKERNEIERIKLNLENEKLIFEREKHRDALQHRADILELKIKKIEVMKNNLN